MKYSENIKFKLFSAFALSFLIIIAIFGGGGGKYAPAFADTANSTYSNVFDDLRQDRNFNVDDYPMNEKDTKLYVIQIAESTDGELLAYTYQPCALKYDLRASSINIARDKNNTIDLSFNNYKLTYLNSAGVFYKYKVEGFALSSDTVRYYNVSNILRPHSYLLDGTLSGGNKETEVKNAVGKLFSAVTVNGTVQYNCIESETIEIENKYCGYMALPRGFKFQSDLSGEVKKTIRNFVAFSTDKPIDRLIEVEMQYDLQWVYFHICGSKICTSHGQYETFGARYGDEVTQEPITLRADDEKDGSNKYGYGGRNFTWDKIQRTSDFLAEVEKENSDYILVNNATKEQFAKTQWLLNFYNADWTMTNDNLFDYHYDVNTERVSGVIILRLMFEANGEIYNLGAVDNKQTGSNSPAVVGKSDTIWDKIKDFFKSLLNHINDIPWWVWVIVAVIGLAILSIVFSILFPAVRQILKAIGNGLWLVISAPFRLIAKAISSRKSKPKKRGKRK